jgi:hypothetical protein
MAQVTGGRPTLGSWLTYGLGSENQDLPAYVALTDPRGLPVLGVDNFSNGWLPSSTRAPSSGPKSRASSISTPPMSLKGEAQAATSTSCSASTASTRSPPRRDRSRGPHPEL